MERRTDCRLEEKPLRELVHSSQQRGWARPNGWPNRLPRQRVHLFPAFFTISLQWRLLRRGDKERERERGREREREKVTWVESGPHLPALLWREGRPLKHCSLLVSILPSLVPLQDWAHSLLSNPQGHWQRLSWLQHHQVSWTWAGWQWTRPLLKESVLYLDTNCFALFCFVLFCFVLFCLVWPEWFRSAYSKDHLEAWEHIFFSELRGVVCHVPRVIQAWPSRILPSRGNGFNLSHRRSAVLLLSSWQCLRFRKLSMCSGSSLSIKAGHPHWGDILSTQMEIFFLFALTILGTCETDFKVFL